MDKIKKKRGGWGSRGFNRREFIYTTLGGIMLGMGVHYLRPILFRRWWHKNVFISKAQSYNIDLTDNIVAGLKALGITQHHIQGKRILLKPNLVETNAGDIHINTHPSVVYGAAQGFLKLGAAKIIVAEGPGHYRDSLLALEESGMAEMLWQEKIPFVDLNYDACFDMPNLGHYSSLTRLTFPKTLKQVDWVVSMPKMKTHHWAGVTLSMKNLFGVMPGMYYGWPKNVFHYKGIPQSILDIVSTLRPQFAIVDGIVGMEEDGPIMGKPKNASVLVMGDNLPAVDATCARIMGINPHKISYLAEAAHRLGPVFASDIRQLGESISATRTDFQLPDNIPAFRGLRL